MVLAFGGQHPERAGAGRGVPDETTQQVLRQYGVGLLGQLGPAGEQVDIALYYMGEAVVGQIAMLTHPDKVAAGIGQAAQSLAQAGPAVVQFLSNSDPHKWIPLRDQAMAAISGMAQHPARAAGQNIGSGLLPALMGPLILPLRACPRTPLLTATVEETEQAASRISTLEKAAGTPEVVQGQGGTYSAPMPRRVAQVSLCDICGPRRARRSGPVVRLET